MARHKNGLIVSISVQDGVFYLGRLLNEPILLVYDYFIDAIEGQLDFYEIINLKPLFYVSVFRDFTKNDSISILGMLPVEDAEINRAPPLFWQSRGNPNTCFLVYLDGSEEAAKPEDCIGLERMAVWEVGSVIQRIVDHRNGSKNKLREKLKVIIP
ncbi:MAG: hypothetical protein AAF696_26465 [Bacteroidota bacterium]